MLGRGLAYHFAVARSARRFARFTMERVLVSACLLGERVRYHGGDARLDHPILERWREEGRLVPICPEVAGGLSTPRPAAEITRTPGGLRVLTADGLDRTPAFERGASAAVHECASGRIRVAVLKDGSPSCGTRIVYDGTFSGTRVEGQGLAAARLRAEGVAIFSEADIEAAADYLATLER
jgi:uncharacterized protein YbbK (DUF523 family)